MLLDYSCAVPKQAIGLTYPEPDFSPEVQSLSVPLYGEQFRQFPINAEIMSLLESCHLRVLDYFPQENSAHFTVLPKWFIAYIAQPNIRDEIITTTDISQILCHSNSSNYFILQLYCKWYTFKSEVCGLVSLRATHICWYTFRDGLRLPSSSL